MHRSLAYALAAAALLGVPAGAAAAPQAQASAVVRADHDRGEVRIVGRVTRLSSTQVTVANARRMRTFAIRPGTPLHGVRVGDRVEAEGRRIQGVLTLLEIHRED